MSGTGVGREGSCCRPECSDANSRAAPGPPQGREIRKSEEAPEMIDEIQVFERALGTPSGDRYIFQLFVTGTTPRSMRAIQNLRKMCDTHLEGRYEMKVVDIYQHPEQARSDQ